MNNAVFNGFIIESLSPKNHGIRIGYFEQAGAMISRILSIIAFYYSKSTQYLSADDAQELVPY